VNQRFARHKGTSLEPFESAANAPSTLAPAGSKIAREDGGGATDNWANAAPHTATASTPGKA
jgi:hypothetical protein